MSTVADYMRLREKMEREKREKDGDLLEKVRVSVEVNDYGVWI